MSQTAADTSTLVILSATTCASCGIAFGIPSHFEAKKRADHSDFYCPNGHVLVFRGETDADKYKRWYEQEKQRLEAMRDQRDRRDRQLSAARGRITKIKNRVARGVCPCCNRTFANLARHMGSQHPGYSSQELP